MTIYETDSLEAVRHAKAFLSHMAGLWPKLPEEHKPSVLNSALWNLTLCWLDNPLQAEIRLKMVAEAMDIPKDSLRGVVAHRAAFLSVPSETRDDKFKELLCQLMLA